MNKKINQLYTIVWITLSLRDRRVEEKKEEEDIHKKTKVNFPSDCWISMKYYKPATRKKVFLQSSFGL